MSAIFDRGDLTITLYSQEGEALYTVDLERAMTSAELLDWIMQVHGKSWATCCLVNELLAAINGACREVFGAGVQGAFCPGGRSNSVDWSAGEVRRET